MQIQAPPSQRGIRSGLRSAAATALTAPFESDPESILRNRRKSQKAIGAPAKNLPQPLTYENLNQLERSVETASEDDITEFDYGLLTKDSDEDTFHLTQDTQKLLYYEWGYLPPLDDKLNAMLSYIAENPASATIVAEKLKTRNPGSSTYVSGLEARNVRTMESPLCDPIEDLAMNASIQGDFPHETPEEKSSFGLLWKLDQAKCNRPANEALFQRTLMISLVARHCLIYQRSDTREQILDFSVEQPWTCPPMPSRDYDKKKLRCLASSKPDLAVCFCRETVIPDGFWNTMPDSMKRLICYENLDESGRTKVFCFFTIEAKKSLTSPGNRTALHQNLNNASQALHNMFEIFRDAGHEEIYFREVRFFSVVASSEGLLVRVHRAMKVRRKEDLIMKNRPDYPLSFEFRECATFAKGFNFEREKVLHTFERILHGYAVQKLLPLLQDATVVLMKKLTKNAEQMRLRQDDEHYYQYGQINWKKDATVDKSGANTSNAGTPTAAEPGHVICGSVNARPISNANANTEPICDSNARNVYHERPSWDRI